MPEYVTAQQPMQRFQTLKPNTMKILLQTVSRCIGIAMLFSLLLLVLQLSMGLGTFLGAFEEVGITVTPRELLSTGALIIGGAFLLITLMKLLTLGGLRGKPAYRKHS